MPKLSNLRNLVLKYLVAIVLIVVPLYPKFPFIRIPGTFVSIRLEDLVFVFSGLVLLTIYLPKLKTLLKSRLNMSIIVFLSVGLVSVFSAIFLTKTVIPHIGLLHWMRRLEYFIPLFLSIEAIRSDRKNLDFYLKICILVVIVVFIYGFGQKHFGWPIIITQNEEYSKGVALRWIPGSHINSTFAGHYDLASYLVLVLPIFVNLLFKLRTYTGKLVLLLTLFCGLWLLINSASRISLFSYMISTSLALLLIKKLKAIPVVVIVTIIFVIFSSNLLDRYLRLIQVAKEDFMPFNRINYELLLPNVYASDIQVRQSTNDPTPTPVPVFEDRSTNIRLNVEWPRALRAFSKNPLLGTGYSSITLATDNDYLRLLGEIGILGFSSFILIFLTLTIKYLKVFPLANFFKDTEYAFVAGILGALPGIFTNALFIDIFEASKFAIVFWLLIGISVSLTEND